MGGLAKAVIGIAVICLIVGIISRLTLKPIVVEAQAYLQFAQACLLLAISLLLLEKK